MAEEQGQVLETAGKAQERGEKVLAELLSVANAERVFSEPVVAGDTTIITAAEISTGMGFGYGLGTHLAASARRKARSSTDGSAALGRQPEDVPEAAGGGGGGGGGAIGRPVAVITIGPDGVGVQPVVDRTKIAVTALTAIGGVWMMLMKMRRAGRG